MGREAFQLAVAFSCICGIASFALAMAVRLFIGVWEAAPLLYAILFNFARVSALLAVVLLLIGGLYFVLRR